MSKLIKGLSAATLGLLVVLPGAAPAKEKRERARLSLPILVAAPSEPGRTYSFREGEFWGWQPARYRSAVMLASALPLPELWAGAEIPAGMRLVELQASSRDFSGPLYCMARQRNEKANATLICLADRNGDGAVDQLWTGGAASMKFLVPFPQATSVRRIEPVQVIRLEEPSSLSLQFGFFVSGTNPIFGTHHFYPMLSAAGEVGFPFTDAKNSTNLKGLPKAVSVAGAEILVESFGDKQYRARVSRPFATGERALVGEVPKQTMYISVPG